MTGALVSALPGLPVLQLLLKVTAVLACAWSFAALLRRRSAAERHFVWLAALAATLAIVVLTPFAPRIAIPVHRIETVAGGDMAPPPSSVARGSALLARRLASPSRARTLPGLAPGSMLLALWLTGCGSVLLWSAVGHVGLWRLGRGMHPADTSIQSGLPTRPHVRLGTSAAVSAPVTWGWRRPVVLFPREAEDWPAERLRVALEHELAHVVRGDYLAQTLATIACAIYWFHPLVWLAASRLRSESEHACDDRVLARGTPAGEYASRLVEVARRARAMRACGYVAVGMARRSHLEGRLLAVLDESQPRGGLAPRRALGAATAIGLLLIPLAGIRPTLLAAAAPAKPSTARTTRTSDEGSSFERVVAAVPGEELTLDLETGGEVEISGWDEKSVRVGVELGGDDWRDTRAVVEKVAGGVRVSSTQTHASHSYSTSHAFKIRVPRRYDVRISSAGGGLNISGVEGDFRGQTGGGQIVIENAKGSMHLSTGGGDIQVDDSELDGHVSTGGGLVKLSGVRGGLRASSGSGPVIYAGNGSSDEKADLKEVHVDDSHIDVEKGAHPGMLHIDKAGGAVDLGRAPDGAKITTGGGDVRVGRSAGMVDASTGGGDMEIGPVAGSVRASTGAGRVRVTITDAGGKAQNVDVLTGTGTVILELPANMDARFELETAYTRNFGGKASIKSAWALERSETSDWDSGVGTPRRYVRAIGVAGKGRGLVRVVCVNGDIEVRRGAL